MDDVIYRQDAIKSVGYYHCHSGDKLLFADNALKELPSAHRCGHWIADDDCLSDYCSECGEPCATYAMGEPRDRYCKWCGADMRGETDG